MHKTMRQHAATDRVLHIVSCGACVMRERIATIFVGAKTTGDSADRLFQHCSSDISQVAGKSGFVRQGTKLQSIR